MSRKTFKAIIEFPDPESMLAWFDEIKSAGHLPERAELFETDAMDMNGRAAVGEYIARNKDERPEVMSLRQLVAERDQLAGAARQKLRRARRV